MTAATPVTLSWDNGEGLVFKRTVSVDDDYMFKIVDAVENRGGEAVMLAPYARVHRYGTPKVRGYWILHEGLIGVIGEQGELVLTQPMPTMPIGCHCSYIRWLGRSDCIVSP